MDSLKLGDLKSMAKTRKIAGYSRMNKRALLDALDVAVPNDCETVSVKECENGICKLAEKPKVSNDIDWDLLLKKVGKQTLVAYGECVKITLSSKKGKRELLDEILLAATKKVYDDLMS